MGLRVVDCCSADWASSVEVGLEVGELEELLWEGWTGCCFADVSVRVMEGGERLGGVEGIVSRICFSVVVASAAG